MPGQDPPLQPQIDLDKLDYPSDGITIKHLRHLFPQEFRGDQTEFSAPYFLEPSDKGQLLNFLLDFERLLASYAFDRALGRTVKEGTFTRRDDLWEHLEELYTTFHIAQGPQHARQMLRDLETAAAEQARQHISGRRP
jgi:hypothetical protein